jgi:16S rRNA (cytosine967-C5)-methyltransferase
VTTPTPPSQSNAKPSPGASPSPSPSKDGELRARKAALGVLEAVEERGAWSTTVVPNAIKELSDPRDRGFAAHLAYETIRWQGTLDYLMQPACSRPLEEVEPALRRVLRLGTLQLWRSNVPPHAAVTTSVDLARGVVPHGRAQGAGGFVNGVLRAVARSLEGDGPHWPADARERAALITGHPRWMVDDLADRMGLERATAALAADSESPGPTLRAVGDRDALLAELRAAGIDAEPGMNAPESIRISGVDPRTIPAVIEGRARPQDEASMMVVHAAQVQPGDRVLDLCAGPGGKTTHLATLTGPTGSVVAVEMHQHRAQAIERAAETLGVDGWVQVRVADAAHPQLHEDDRFDVILLDAPCSGLGTGRRRPEVRWKRTPSDVEALGALQRRLLASAGRWLAPGGRLVYAVCTWTAGETDDVVDAATPSGMVVESRRQLLPDVEDTDGMYLAVLTHASHRAAPSAGADDIPLV